MILLPLRFNVLGGPMMFEISVNNNDMFNHKYKYDCLVPCGVKTLDAGCLVSYC